MIREMERRIMMERKSGMLNQFGDKASVLLGMSDVMISWVDVIEILIISFLIYHVLLWVKNTRAWNLFKGIVIILLFILVAAIFQMTTILWLAENLLNVGLIALVIINPTRIWEPRTFLAASFPWPRRIPANFPTGPSRN